MKSLNEFKKEEDLICHLLKSLYRLKQSLQIWAKILRSFLKRFNLIRLESNYYIFVSWNTDIIIAVYVDDLLLIKPIAESLQDLKDKLMKQFNMTDMSLAEDYLNIEISQQ